jgi:hypothetical protein
LISPFALLKTVKEFCLNPSNISQVAKNVISWGFLIGRSTSFLISALLGCGGTYYPQDHFPGSKTMSVMSRCVAWKEIEDKVKAVRREEMYRMNEPAVFVIRLRFMFILPQWTWNLQRI